MAERSIFLHALDLVGPAERAAYLDAACAGDAAARRRIDDLLAAAGAPGTFMAAPAAAHFPNALLAETAVLAAAAEFFAPSETRTGPGDPHAGPGPLPVIPGYEMEEELARGGMGVVYKARHLRLNRPAAVKMILGGKYSDPAARVRFLVEAEAVAALDHAYVVGVYEFGQVDGVPFFALEYVPGGTLAAWVARDGRPTARAAAELVAKLADAVAAAHAKGIVHRDLKPANVLLTAAGEPKVTDFGLAKVGRSDMTATGAVMGTPSYMSPEQAAGRTREIGTPTDVYALGAILYELLTGRPPFKGDSVMATIQQVLTLAPQRPRSADATIPRDLETICLKCLEKEPTRRYETAAALAADLAAFLAGRPIQARPTGATERAWKWVRRNPVVAGLLVAVGLLLTAGAVGGAVAAAQFNDKANAALRAKEETDAARRAVGVQLWKSRLNEARANTRSGQPGQRFESLKLLKSALADAQESGLTAADRKQFRDVAVAALALPDLEVVREWPGFPLGTTNMFSDTACERYARTGADGAVTVRRVEDDVVLFSLPPTGTRRGVVLSGTGKLMLVGDWNDNYVPGRSEVYDLSGPEPRLLHQADMVFTSTGQSNFSPTDDRVVYSTGRAVVVWDKATGRTVSHPFPGGQTCRMAISADGRRVAIPAGGIVRVREVETGAAAPDVSFAAPIETVALHPTGQYLAVNQGNTIVVRDLNTGRDVALMDGHRSKGMQLEFDPSGDYLLSNDWSSLVRLWDWRAGRQVLTAPGGYGLLGVGGGRILTMNFNQGTVRVSRLDTGAERYHYGPARRVLTNFSIDPAGRMGVTADFTNPSLTHLIITDGVRGSEVGRLSASRLRPVGFAGDGSLLTSHPQGVACWPRSEVAGSGLVRFGPPELTPVPTSGTYCSASPDGRVVAIPGGTHSVRAGVVVRTDRCGGVPVSLGTQFDVRNSAVSPDGRFVATGSHEPTDPGVRVWDARTGGVVTTLPVTCGFVTFSPDGRWLATSGGGHRLWRTDTWGEGPKIADPLDLPGCVLSPDVRGWERTGGLLAIAGYASIRLVRAADGTELVRLPYAELGQISPVSFSPDGSVLYALGANSIELTAWDLRQLRAQLHELDLDWDEPPLPPRIAPAAVSRVEFVGGDLLTDSRKENEHWRRGIEAGIRANPFDSNWYTRWGVGALNGGFVYGARIIFDIALFLNPAREDARLHRAKAYLQLQQYEAAVKDATVVLGLMPTQLATRGVRATAYRQLGRPAEAAADLSVVLDFYPNHCTSLIRRGAAYAATGDVKKAAADLALADRLVGGAATTDRNSLAWHYLTGPPALRNPKRGLELATRVVAEKSTTTYLNTLGVAKYRNGLFKEAAATLDPTVGAGDRHHDALSLYFLAMCRFKLGDAAKAGEDFTRAVSATEAMSADSTALQRNELRSIRAEAAEVLGRK